jgi:AmmeMemoRadiSam system protein A
MTSGADRQLLLQIARVALTAHVGGVPAPDPVLIGAAARPAGAFVTLHHRRALRGCIGHIEPTDALGRVVARCAVAAGSADPRFPPVRSCELADLRFELSILGPLERINTVDEIEVGRHGLVVETRWHRGLLLPQVATEWGWGRVEFLEHTCQKAGLPRDAWQRDTSIWKFEAEVFGEPENRSVTV